MFIRIMKTNEYINMDDVRSISVKDGQFISFMFRDGSMYKAFSSDFNLSINETLDKLEEVMKLCNLSRASEIMDVPRGMRQAAWEEFNKYVCDIPRL